MSTETRLRARVLRRELHSSKSGPAITIALLAAAALAWVCLESVLAALGRPAALMSPASIASAIRSLPNVPPVALGAAGVLIALVGLALVIVALSSGRRGRHVIDASGTAAVVDDEVIASALVRSAAAAAGMSPDRAVASVGYRTATVRLTPVSGVDVDLVAVQRAAAEAADGFALRPAITVRAVLDRRGRVGG